MIWWGRLTNVSHANHHTRRKGRLLAIVLLTLSVLAIVFIPVSLFGPTPTLSVGIIAVCVAGFVGMLVLVRGGRVTLAGWLFVLTVTAAITINIVLGGTLASIFFLVGHARHPWWHRSRGLLRAGIGAGPAYLTTLIYATLLQVASTVLSVLGAQAIAQALHTAEANAQEATTA